jgi:integrase
LNTKKAKRIPIKRGSVTVWIYPTPSKNGYPGWTVVFFEPDGTRKRIFRAGLEDARRIAEENATRLSNLGSATAQVTESDAVELVMARQIAGRLGKPLLTLVQEHYDLTAKLASKGSLSLAVESYIRHHKEAVIAKAVSELVPEFLLAQENDGLGERHLRGLKERLALFSEHFQCLVSDLTSDMLNAWLRSEQVKRSWTGRTRNHYRAAISVCMSYARKQRYLPRDWVEMDFVPKAVEEDGVIEIYKPDDLEKILHPKPDKDLLPVIVIGAFAGLRPSEIFRLTWGDFYFNTGELFVGKGKVRTAGNRVAPLLPVLQEWLGPLRKQKWITRLRESNYVPYLREWIKGAGVTSVYDGLRHSFISYRRALTKNLPQVSSETGTDVTTLTKRYCKPVPVEDAEAWFNS